MGFRPVIVDKFKNLSLNGIALQPVATLLPFNIYVRTTVKHPNKGNSETDWSEKESVLKRTNRIKDNC